MNEEITIHDLVYKLDWTRVNRCEAIDPLLAEKITDLDKLYGMGYYLQKKDLVKVLPKTKEKINEVILKSLSDNEINAWSIRALDVWLDTRIHNEFAKRWLNNGTWDTYWLVNNINLIDDDLRVKMLAKFMEEYKESKSKYKVGNIETIFKVLTKKENFEAAAKLLSEGTPALQACLLSRADLKEEYITKGLKSISKLAKQRNVSAKIDLEVLKNLGPRSRLDAMKQLLGITNPYYSKDMGLPFKTIPTTDEVSQFLFPCSIKYNEEVSKVINRFKEITGDKIVLEPE
jgi:hypothetical protein